MVKQKLDADVIIVGGAVAGSALANALGSHGISTLLIEKVSREVHSTRGDLLHPPTLRILDNWGVLKALHSDGTLPITELAVSHRDRGLIARSPCIRLAMARQAGLSRSHTTGSTRCCTAVPKPGAVFSRSGG